LLGATDTNKSSLDGCHKIHKLLQRSPAKKCREQLLKTAIKFDKIKSFETVCGFSALCSKIE
jgi:hypothetical protein